MTRQEEDSKAADFRRKEKERRFANYDEISKEQGEVKELCNLRTDSSGDYSLEQNDSYQSNGGQNTRPSGVFGEGSRGVLREGPRGGFPQGQSSNQGFKGMGVSQGEGVDQGHPQKPKTRYRGRGRRRGAWQTREKEQCRFQQNQLLVSGLSASTTEDCLVNFIEAMSSGEVETVMLRRDKALVTMANDITGKLTTEV